MLLTLSGALATKKPGQKGRAQWLYKGYTQAAAESSRNSASCKLTV